MKFFLILLLISTSAWTICFKGSVPSNYSCEKISSKAADKYCSNYFGDDFQAYKTTESCPISINGLSSKDFESQSYMSFETSWNKDFKKDLKVSCKGQYEYICHEICAGAKSCEIKEGVCKDCVGTSIEVINFYKTIGTNITSGIKTNGYALTNLINSENFVSFSSKSIYNILTSYDSKGVKRKFKTLCDDNTEYPLVFASVYNKTRQIIGFQFVVCKSGVFEINQGLY